MEPSELFFGVGTDPSEVSAALSASYTVRVRPSVTGRWTCLDTADWRVHDAGLTLSDSRNGRLRSLVLSGRGQDRVTAPAPARAWPHRIDALPASPVRDRIAAVVGVRALLPLAEVGTRAIPLDLLDEQDKTRVRLKIEQQRLIGSRRVPLPLRVVVSPLRGYQRDGERCTELLQDAISSPGDFLDASGAALAAAGHTPGQPAVPPVLLDPDAPAAESLARVLRRWMDVIDSVVPGVLADIDPEFLHELRTSVRGIRSLLRLSADVVPEAQFSRFTADFAWLGQLSGPLRDLDVSLRQFAVGSETAFPGIAGLEPVQRQLAAQRRRELSAVRRGLQSPRGTALSGDWRAALGTLSAPEATGPTTRSRAAAQTRLAYRRIVKAAAPVTDVTDPEELHRLRRRCKQMRYLLDAYASVYPPQPQREVLSALKALQDCLGEIQDVEVQRRQVTDLADALRRRDADTETLLALGAVRDRTLQRDAAARRTLGRRLKRFCSAQTRARVAALGTADG